MPQMSGIPHVGGQVWSSSESPFESCKPVSEFCYLLRYRLVSIGLHIIVLNNGGDRVVAIRVAPLATVRTKIYISSGEFFAMKQSLTFRTKK